ncbi:MAG: hypothetical protein WHU10_01670 [Fimbriimonadales bacterium]
MVHRRVRGALLVDLLLALGVMLLATLGFLSLFPVAHRSQALSSERSTAAKIASRMIEHLQMLPRRDLRYESLRQLNLIDASPTSSPYSFTNLPLDDGAQYSPSTALPQGTGALMVIPLDHGAVMAVIEIRWTSRSGREATYRTGTVLGRFR